MPFIWGMNDLEKEKALFTQYPFHICLMVKAAKKALEEGRASIQDGILVLQPPIKPPKSGRVAVENPLDEAGETKVESSSGQAHDILQGKI
jgi:hypothetical protein